MNISINSFSKISNSSLVTNMPQNYNNLNLSKVSFGGSKDILCKTAQKTKNLKENLSGFFVGVLLDGLFGLAKIKDYLSSKSYNSLKSDINSLYIDIYASEAFKYGLNEKIEKTLEKKSLDTDCTNFIKESLTFISDNINSNRLFPVHTVMGCEMKVEGKKFLNTITQALDKTMNKKSIYNNDLQQKIDLMNKIDAAKDFMKRVNQNSTQ